MALLKKKKKKLVIRSGGGGSSGAETSTRRPYQLEKDAPCMSACPQGTEIRSVLMTIAQAEKYERPQEDAFMDAWEILTKKNPLPATCGRVCPHPCEDACNRIGKDGALAINNVERFIGDWGIEKNLPYKKLTDETQKEKVAVLGAGPAGLGCAYHLARQGYGVTIFEAFSKAGGMLRYGIPAYRLPHNILDGEIQKILDLGVELKTNIAVGKDIPYEQVQSEFDAIFVGIGAHKGKGLWLEGEDSANVFSGVGFLNQVNGGSPVEIGDKVVVIGGGDTAIDAARVALRLGSKEVTILYRRTRNEMPAIEEEIVGAEEEGIIFHFLAAPKELVIEDGKVVKMECQQMELGEPDSSGRRRPVPIEDDTFTVELTALIPAISQEPDFEGLDNLHEGRDWVKVDDWGKTKEDKTYSGGDVLDLGLVTVALAQGKLAADTIHAQFRGIELKKAEPLPPASSDRMLLNFYEKALRHECESLPVEKRFDEMWTEISSTLPEADLIEEAKRCMSCGSCFDCGTCWSYCQDQAIIKPMVPGEPYKFKLEFCKGCDKCKEACPCGYIEMK
ncbi:MAG: FAD-dependent oxidoreductase [Calditrichaeota bacterium]|nr:FAD-dependent oxidoreductase [Calditrichota bacterium]